MFLNVKNNIEKNRKKVSSEVGFGFLFRVFKTKIIFHFSLAVIMVALNWCLNSVNRELFNEEGGSSSNHFCATSNCQSHTVSSLGNTNDRVSPDHNSHSSLSSTIDEGYGKYLPFWNYWKDFYPFETVQKGQLAVITISFILLYSLFSYLYSSVGKEITAETYFYLKNILFGKFWKIGIEEKKKNYNEVRTLLENELETVSESWEHLPSHLFENVFVILVFGLERFFALKNTNQGFLIFSIIFILISIVIYTIISSSSVKKYELYKKAADEELAIVNKQISNAQLIENMGLTNFYEKLRNEYAKETLSAEKVFNRVIFILSISIYSLTQVYRYSGFPFINDSFPLRTLAANVYPFFMIFSSISNVLDCYKDYGRYRLACSRVSSFLAIKEREENLLKESIVNLEIEEIKLANVDFKYQLSERLVLENYSRKFSRGSINRIVGSNGSGKTTILFLILGIIKPLRGEVLVKFSGAGTINLHQEINLSEWRERIVAYLSHDNLIENGSTGQRQLKNISTTLEQRKDSQIFIFDESANALDSENQKDVMEKLVKIVSENKIVILVQHKASLVNDDKQ